MKMSVPRLALDIPEVCIFFSWMHRHLPTGPWTISSLTAVTLTLACTMMVSWQFSYTAMKVINIFCGYSVHLRMALEGGSYNNSDSKEQELDRHYHRVTAAVYFHFTG